MIGTGGEHLLQFGPLRVEILHGQQHRPMDLARHGVQFAVAQGLGFPRLGITDPILGIAAAAFYFGVPVLSVDFAHLKVRACPQPVVLDLPPPGLAEINRGLRGFKIVLTLRTDHVRHSSGSPFRGGRGVVAAAVRPIAAARSISLSLNERRRGHDRNQRKKCSFHGITP